MFCKVNSAFVNDDSISDNNDFISPSDSNSDRELHRGQTRNKSKLIECKVVERLETKERIDFITTGNSYCYSLKQRSRVLK